MVYFRLHLMECIDAKALFRVSQQDPYIADEIIKLFEKTCKVEASNPR